MMKKGPFIAALMIATGAPAWSDDGFQSPAPSTNATNITRPTPVTSHQRNFIVTGMSGRDALSIAVWAEKTKEQFESLVGERIPSRRMYPVIISAEVDTDARRGWSRGIQQITGEGNLRQELILMNPAMIDQEDVLEHLCGLFLDRWIADRMKKQKESSIPEMPDWLAVGLAQQLYPGLRARNLQEILAMISAGKPAPSAAAILEWMRFPPGRWPEKALAGLLVEWMRERIPVEQVIDSLADAYAAGLAMDPAAVTAMCGYADPRDFNMAFDVWLARQKTRVIPGAFASDTHEVEEILALPAARLGIIWPEADSRKLTPEMLVMRRDEAWVQALARTMQIKLGLALLSQPPEVAQAVDGYIRFYSELAQHGRRHPDQVLLKWSKDAARAFAALQSRRRQIRALVDAVDFPSFSVEPANRDALEEMLDRLEAEIESAETNAAHP